MLKLVFDNGCASVKLRDGRTAYIYENRGGYYRQMLYPLAVDDDIIFTRAGLAKIRQYLHNIM